VKEIEILNDVYKLVDNDGNLLLEVPIMEIYYLIGFCMEEANHTISRVEKAKYTAEKINAEYGCELSWANVLDILNKIDKILEESKKNSTGTLE
jgi:hypothetical protein